jgi:hypothetical protein
MRLRRACLAGMLVTLGLVACVTTNATRLGDGPTRPRIDPEQVVIYRSAEQVPGRYEEVAILHSEGEASWTNEEGMYKSMRKKAGEMGANAIVLDAVSEPSAGAKIAGAFFGTGAERKGKAIAIYVFPGGEDSQ